MLRSVFGKSLWDQRRGILIWSLGVAGVGVMYAAFYPTLNSPEMIEFMEAYPKEIMDAMGITDLTSPEGYLGGTTYGILGPILMIIVAASLGHAQSPARRRPVASTCSSPTRSPDGGSSSSAPRRCSSRSCWRGWSCSSA
jgi:hypothetical protein